MESSSWGRWCGDGGGVGGRRWCDAGGGHLLDLAVGDLLDGGNDDGNRGGCCLLELTVGDLLDDGRSDNDNRGGCCLLELTVGDLLDDGNRGGDLLNLTVANLSGEGRGSERQSDEDGLDGRHFERWY